jgi:excisionase family DNA binding protein
VLPALLTLEQVTEALQCSRQTLRTLLDAGEISATKVGATYRFYEIDVEAYLERRRIGRKPPRTTQPAPAAAQRRRATRETGPAWALDV